jgi:hypothetical protein
MKTAMQEIIELIVNNKTRLDIIEKNQKIWLEKEKMQNLNLIRFMRTNDKMGKSTEDLYNEFLTRIVYEMV